MLKIHVLNLIQKPRSEGVLNTNRCRPFVVASLISFRCGCVYKRSNTNVYSKLSEGPLNYIKLNLNVLILCDQNDHKMFVRNFVNTNSEDLLSILLEFNVQTIFCKLGYVLPMAKMFKKDLLTKKYW